MSKKAYLILEDGLEFEGVSFGCDADSPGEIVFNTSMSGYQEILTDPSYSGQIVAMTYPMIGNYGVNEIDVLMDFTSGNKRTFLDESFGGGIYPNTARFIAFSLLFILLLALVITTIIQIDGINDKRRKNKLIKVFKEYDTDKVTEKDSFFFGRQRSKRGH